MLHHLGDKNNAGFYLILVFKLMQEGSNPFCIGPYVAQAHA